MIALSTAGLDPPKLRRAAPFIVNIGIPIIAPPCSRNNAWP
jgi:hypothetical protein